MVEEEVMLCLAVWAGGSVGSASTVAVSPDWACKGDRPVLWWIRICPHCLAREERQVESKKQS